ncbi:sulfatase family protein [Rhodopirellula sp. MGV]|uniref:sulfatase family protein n=1 Tax=Rhodopirellula sp. MGV TaxID=2023130 RepID=UPI000B95E316|nr:arylsulfatase [Rhodopirellula sp. MGV]OYP37950.1 arylsulfatase [Rhodopirellula sp. MGV]PNY34252.1 arylsulfatase [Rhodopirellula baltica]
MRSTSLSAFLVFIAVAFSSIGSTDAGAAEKLPNILIVLVDDMGFGDPRCFNPKSKIPTPNIDRLAAEGMRFTDAHASGPLCHMSRYGLMTGRYPFRINVGQWPKHALIQEGEVTLPSLLRDAGYRTAMVGKWHVGFDENGYDRPLPGGPVDRGFDSFFGIRASTDIPPYFYIRDRNAVTPPTDSIEANQSGSQQTGSQWNEIQGAFWRAGGIAPELDLVDVTPRFTSEACDIIRSHQGNDQPLMLYLALPSPHTPWLPLPKYEGQSKAGLYGDFMTMVDDMFGKVLGALEDAGMKENTLVIFSSDNGPVWYDKDTRAFGHDSCGGLRGMKADAWEAGHRMPMVVRWPGVVKPGSSSDATVSFVDFVATMDELVGSNHCVQSTSESEAIAAGPDSFSFLSELTGKPSDRPKRESLALQSGRGLMTYRRGPWKLIEGDGSGGFSDRGPRGNRNQSYKGQLYNLDHDLGETKNLVDEHPKIVASLREELAAIIDAERSR